MRALPALERINIVTYGGIYTIYLTSYKDNPNGVTKKIGETRDFVKAQKIRAKRQESCQTK